MNSAGKLEPFLNVRETAEFLGVHENTVRNWVKAGILVSARVPGSKQHRFAREEVLRLQRKRGSITSSVAPTLRTDGPELITANELNIWAARDDAKTAFPELMRRLLAVTPGISNLQVRAHEGVAASGWDGTATSAGSAYLPVGELRFEFGTEANPKGKAQSDYDKRVLALPADASSVFVFATPRNWASGNAWASDRAAEKRFSDVKAIDAHILEGWLQELPPVHRWISERLGYRPRDAQTIERWWQAFQGRTTVALPADFFTAGRIAEADELRATLTAAGSGDEIVAIQAPWSEEALAFTFAALAAQNDLLYRAIVVTDSAAWQRLTESRSPLILVPLFSDAPDLAAAIDNGHRVILIAEPGDIIRNANKIELRKVDRATAREALKTVVSDSKEAEAMVALARRSLPALVRSIAREPRFRAPKWVTDTDQAAILAPLVLVGSWTNSEGDLAVIERLTGRSRDDIDRLLRSLAGRADAPFVRSGGTWRVTSPTEAALLLLPMLIDGELAKWAEVVADVLLTPDPYQGMDAVARLTASAQGINPTHSETLREGVADGLALAAASDVEPPADLAMQERVSRLVHDLLQAANADDSGKTWARLASVLPSLAEAAPEVFQDAVELDLDRTDPILRTMFQDSGADTLFGPSSPHPNLLWALETLCWSSTYFGRAAALLGRLSALDPGGRLSNRPIESLQNVAAGWLPQSGASVDDKLAVIARLMQREPDVGWKLALGVWPESRATAFQPHAPTYRDWSPIRQSVTYAHWGHFVHELVILVTAAAGAEAARWKELIPQIGQLPSQERVAVLAKLREVIDAQDWSPEDVYAVWETLSSEADRHEEYSDAEWAMPAEDVVIFRELADSFVPAQDGRRFSRLFNWRAHVPDLKPDDEGYDIELVRLQREALDHVLVLGSFALRSLTIDVKTPHEVGRLLADMDNAPDQEILGWLRSSEPNLNQAALNYASVKIHEGGMEWLKEAFASPALQEAEAREILMTAVPLSRQYWSEVPLLGEGLEEAYWNRAQPFAAASEDRAGGVQRFVQHGDPWKAMILLSIMVHEHQEPEISLVKEVFDALRQGTEPPQDVSMSGYYVGKLLEYMEQRVPDDDELPGYEFMFFELVHDHEPSGALYRALSKDPADFVNMVGAIFRAEGEPNRTPTPQEQAFAHLSLSVLREWRTLPGLAANGSVDTDHLTEWIRAARLALADSGRASIGDEQIGQVLASSPVGSDGIWPAEAVREVIENVGNTRIDTGLHIGKTNQRGVTSRGVFDGGDQERVIEQQYREMASKIATRWPRTARILRGIADSYQLEARRNDAEAERMGDDG
ncbi:MAG TPA: helix-turn-helix domain-containing protein [Candidatus Agrococcus pullicola]|uniref:Helix-turn-helix domain-containing protein n=1 Tax=Candidatus Agrococcus pullicola TaxID=2838429 RepID=A0A9D1YVK9_9MICO|nr:helix-turn-helix domain-containing protein [Candidatus Agrococcus pullicola]